MAESCDGANTVPDNKRKTSVDAPESPRLELDSKTSPPRVAFQGFVAFPHVSLERYDITPYLNGHKRPTLKKSDQKKRGKNNDIDRTKHALRLSQKCTVNLKRDDLEQLKNAFKKARAQSPATSSDSEAGDAADMTVSCKICHKSYTSVKKLLKHQQNKHIIYKTPNKTPKRVSFSDHVIVHEVQEYHKCRKCPKFFEDYKSLKQHMRKWHKKRKCYICNYCNKKFVDRMFFKVHIRLHCDVCGSLFSKRSKFLEHRRDKCRVFKVHKCKSCGEAYFNVMDLKDHGYDHDDNLNYVCDICKEKFKTKCAIAHHFAFLHSDKKRPKELYVMLKMGTERLYLCEFCNESSVERDVLETHTQKLPDLTNKATTGYKDYYFCDHCMEQFDTEKDMLQHKWTHFLNTSDNSQTRPKSILKRPEKRFFNINDEIPPIFKPIVVLERLADLNPTQFLEFVQVEGDVETETINPTAMKKPIVDPKSKKTLLSKHRCETCGRYFSSNYCLNRHITTQHEDFDNLRCKVCEETFVWPSLLKSHKCIRLNRPEMPFDDARAEILFENLNSCSNFDRSNFDRSYLTMTGQNGFDDLNLNIEESDDYMNRVDFEIPAPVVELRECDSTFMPHLPVSVPNQYILPDKNGVTSSGYKLIMQEVPIEF